MADENVTCVQEPLGNFTTFFGTTAVPEWEALLTILTLTILILLTIVGNVLVILSVFTYKPLRIVQNFFIVSLAVADLTVAILVMPLNVMYSILGRWVFGIHVCKMWLTSDVLCCTASILNLCAIALDRFWAITDPLNYAQKRTLKRVLWMIGGVWVLSLLISSPPLIGWNDWPDSDKFLILQECKLTARAGYVIYSSLGSFFIPLFIMTIVYVEIFIATKRRLRERAQASKINALAKNNQSALISNNKEVPHDGDSVSSETNHNEHPNDNSTANGKTKDKKAKKNKKKKKAANDKADNPENNTHLKPVLVQQDSLTDNPETSSNSHNPCTSDPKPGAPVTAATTVNNSPQSKASNQRVVVIEPTIVKKPTVVYQFIEERQRISLSKERRAARTLGIIMGVFVVCWLPFFLMYVIIPFCPSCCPSKRLINFITWLGYINSVLNPIIYTIFNLDFRRAFRKLMGMQA